MAVAIFEVDVGNLPTKKAEAIIEKVRKELQDAYSLDSGDHRVVVFPASQSVRQIG